MSVQKVPIHVSNKRAFIWDVDHAAVLRSRYRICGVLAGTLPHLSQQNAFLGLPLILMPEEVVFLVEKEFAVLIDDPNAHREPTADELEKWDASRQLDVKQQHERLEHEASTKEDKSQSEAAIRKRQEREEKRRKAEELARKAADPTYEATHESPSQPSPSPAPESTPSSSIAPYTVTVPASSDAFSWFVPDEYTYSTLESAKAAGIWDYPENEDERAKCEVFRDLWEKGNYMGGGSKFGGDWLVYPGDPLRYHSHFVATVQSSPSAPLRPMEIVAHGRLGTATKKAHLICGWDPVTRVVTYLSVEWASFG
ncbi:tRNA-intron endonuclease catalytic domain-like protein [Dentipellis sp. KUC8613]|nr:tRNA-intron endonuclease catalytic domain-like protein [Dentipellis sp. KUC8613]